MRPVVMKVIPRPLSGPGTCAVRSFQRIAAILEASGFSLDNVLTNTCYVTNRDDLPGFNEVYGEFFPQDRPARTTVVVNFGAVDNLVEITSTACIPD